MKDTRNYILNSYVPNYNRVISSLSTNDFGLDKSKKAFLELCESIKALIEYLCIEKKTEIIKEYGFETGTRRARKLHNQLIDKLKESNSNIYALCNLADAYKHKEIDRAHRVIDSTDQLVEMPTIVRFEDDSGYYYSWMKVLEIRKNNGVRLLAFNEMLTSSRQVLRQCIKFGVIDKLPKTEPYCPFVKREDCTSEYLYETYEGEGLEIEHNEGIFDKNENTLRNVLASDEFNTELNIKLIVKPSII